MMTRLLVFVITLIAVAGAWLLWRQYMVRRVTRAAGPALPAAIAQRLDPTRVNILYFTADHCSQCRLRQTPILDELGRTAPVAIQTIDAVAENELARHFGIMAVPTTIVLKKDHTVRAVNHGVASSTKLQEQIG
ncbi:MAG: thioredoxin family protein [Caldilineaceae bacterium]|nr:thioredoxin family protein [Caldilineaceae bacterium]